MLDDPRATTLITNFASQWLHLRNLRAVAPDVNAFPEFDDDLREAFQRETELFLEAQLREDRSVLDLLTADYTYVNERLARHYGVDGIHGSHFRRVTFGDDRRAGLLGHGSILTVTSYANRTVTGGAGQVAARKLPGGAAATPATRRTAVRRERRERRAFDARADGAASREPGVRKLPCADGPAGFRARELRCHRQVAGRDRCRRSDRRGRRVARRNPL